MSKQKTTQEINIEKESDLIQQKFYENLKELKKSQDKYGAVIKTKAGIVFNLGVYRKPYLKK